VPDEASSALDSPSEQEILQRLRHTLESEDNNLAAVLFITHKKSVLRACDRVAVLSNGRIAEMGVFDSLDSIRGGRLRKEMVDDSARTIKQL
jgi:ABC-type multidrug transport system fused ATPase/permease subunit